LLLFYCCVAVVISSYALFSSDWFKVARIDWFIGDDGSLNDIPEMLRAPSS